MGFNPGAKIAVKDKKNPLKRGVDGKFQIMMVEGDQDVNEWVDVTNQEQMNLLAQQAGAKAAPVKEKPVVRNLFQDETALERMKQEQADLEKKHAEVTQKMRGVRKRAKKGTTSIPRLSSTISRFKSHGP